MPDIRILEHKPKPIDEPTGLGAVVSIRHKVSRNTYTIVRVPNTSTSWIMAKYIIVNLSWESILKNYDVVEIISPGVVDKS